MARLLLVKKTTRLNYSKRFGTFSWFCVLDLIYFPLNLRNTETSKILMCENAAPDLGGAPTKEGPLQCVAVPF